MIPKTLHFIWMQGLEAMPAEYRRCFDSWAPLHPSWEVKLWDRESLGWLKNAWVWEIDNPTVQADVARVEVVHREGGVYLDCDMECVRPIDTLVRTPAFASMRNGFTAENAGFGAVPEHPWIADLAERMSEGRQDIRQVLDADRAFNRALVAHPEVVVLPFQTLHLNGSSHDQGKFPGQSYALHHRFSLWMDDDPRYKDQRRAG